MSLKEKYEPKIRQALEDIIQALARHDVEAIDLKISQIPDKIREIQLDKIVLTINCSEFVSGTIKATKDGKTRTGTVEGGQCVIKLPETGTWHIEHDLGDYVEVEVNNLESSCELVKKKVTFTEGDCSEEKIVVHVQSVVGNNSNDNFIRVKKNGIVIEVQAQLVGSDIEITNFEYEEDATYTIEYVIKDEVRGSVEILISKEPVQLKAEFIGTGMRTELGLLYNCNNAKKLVFTDEKAPDDVVTYDKSVNQNNSVVAWFKDETLFVSSQVKGTKIEMFNCYHNNYNDYLNLFSAQTDSEYKFRSLTEVDLYNLDTSKMTDMSRMFDCSYLDTLVSIKNFDKLDTHLVTNMYGMFTSCKAFSQIDLTNFDTSNVTNMKTMFYGLNVESLDFSNFKKFNTENVIDMESMFANCKNLANLDLSNFNTKSLETSKTMFQSCYKLQDLKLGDNFITPNLNNTNQMFGYCYQLSTVDLSNFFVASDNSINISGMFWGCNKLQTIYAPEWVNYNNITGDTNTFYNCKLLPNFNEKKTDPSMAKWKENGGYFTNPAEKPN